MSRNAFFDNWAVNFLLKGRLFFPSTYLANVGALQVEAHCCANYHVCDQGLSRSKNTVLHVFGILCVWLSY